MNHASVARLVLGSAAVAAVTVGAAGSAQAAGPAASTAAKRQTLTGTFKITPGKVSGATATGSYFRMIYPGGSITGGKFFDNPDSTATDKSYTPVRPGRDGGLTTGRFQPAPSTPFDASGNALANRIIAPGGFAGIKFSVATAARDPQSGRTVPAPTIQVSGGKLSGQVQALTADWSKLYFNQGSPKPDGSSPGLTAKVTGTYNTRTRAYVLEWASSVVGGPFNGFTGYWHLQGTFQPR